MMTTTEQRFEHARFDARAPRRAPEAAGAWYRLILVLAAVAALVTWGLIDGSDNSRAGRSGLSATSAGQQLYDGHGKWGGYMVQ
jgi:hypothetical protein